MVSVEQVKAARALLRWSQRDLAEASGVSHPSIKRLEAASGPMAGRPETVRAIEGALERAGIAFIEMNGGGPGVRLRSA